MPDPGEKMSELPEVAKCVNDCWKPLVLDTEFVKCIKGCCEKYGFKDEDCKVTVVTEKPLIKIIS